jgi:hypothetical protein
MRNEANRLSADGAASRIAKVFVARLWRINCTGVAALDHGGLTGLV